MRTFFFYWLLPFSALTFLLRVEHANYCLGLTLKCLELGIRVPDSLVLRKHIFSNKQLLCTKMCFLFSSLERQNALSGGCVPILSKFAPSSCCTHQILGKKNFSGDCWQRWWRRSFETNFLFHLFFKKVLFGFFITNLWND